MQHRAAGEVPAALHQRHPGQHLRNPRPQPHRQFRVGPQPGHVVRRDQDLGPELPRPRSNGTVEVRMAGGHEPQAPQRAHRGHRRIVDEPGRVPQQVALGRGHQQRPLPDRHRRIRADPGQPRLDRPDVGPVPGHGQLGQRGPALPARWHPLPLVRAHGAHLRARVEEMVTTGHTNTGPHTRTTARSALKDHFTERAVVRLGQPEPQLAVGERHFTVGRSASRRTRCAYCLVTSNSDSISVSDSRCGSRPSSISAVCLTL